MRGWSGLSFEAMGIVVTIVIANLSNSIIAPVVPAIKDEFGSSAAEVALVVSGFGLGRLVMDLPAGYLSDRVSAGRLFIVGMLLVSVTATLAALSNSLQQLIIFRTAMGFGSSIMSTVALTLMVRIARPGQRGSVLSLYTSAMLLGHAFSPTIGGYLATFFSWRATFVFCAVTPLLSLPLNLLATSRVSEAQQSHPARKDHSTEEERSVSGDAISTDRAHVDWPAVTAVYVATLVIFFNRQGMRQSLLPLYGSMVLDMTPATIGTILTVSSFLTILINLPGGIVGDRIGRKRLLVPAMIIICLGNLCLLRGSDHLFYVIATVLISMGVLANSMLSGLVADLVPERLIGKGMGMYRFTGDLGMVFGPFVLGLLIDGFGFAAASVFGALAVLLGIGIVLLSVPRRTAPTSVEVHQEARL